MQKITLSIFVNCIKLLSCNIFICYDTGRKTYKTLFCSKMLYAVNALLRREIRMNLLLENLGTFRLLIQVYLTLTIKGIWLIKISFLWENCLKASTNFKAAGIRNNEIAIFTPEYQRLHPKKRVILPNRGRNDRGWQRNEVLGCLWSRCE